MRSDCSQSRKCGGSGGTPRYWQVDGWVCGPGERSTSLAKLTACFEELRERTRSDRPYDRIAAVAQRAQELADDCMPPHLVAQGAPNTRSRNFEQI